MARWMKPSEEMPSCEVGDRVLVILEERERGRLRKRLVILEATETGWEPTDDFYTGYTPADGVLWSYERDVCQIAAVVCGD